MAIAREGLTLQQFLALPEEKPALEFYRGKVTQKVAPQPQHGALQAGLVLYLGRLLAGRPAVRIFTETRTVLGGMAVVPDLSLYRRERLPREPGGRIGGPGVVPPDAVIEIHSASQTFAELVERCAWYAEQGVPVALLLDPRDESIHVFRPGAMPVVCRGEDRIDLGTLAPGLVLVVGEGYAALDPDWA